MKSDSSQALIDWFPDRKGLASGLVIAGFGSGLSWLTLQSYSLNYQELYSSLR